MGKFIGGVVLIVFLLFGLDSCFFKDAQRDECPVGGCVDGPKQTEFEPLDPEFEFVVP
jgi:hypothetical protein